MAGEGSLNGDLGRLAVADLAHHDDVRILPQNRAQPVRERELDLGIHLHLTDTLQLILDRVFDRDDVALGRVDGGERSVEGRGLAAPGRPGDEHDAVTLMDQPIDERRGPTREPELLEAEQRRRSVEEPKHHTLAVGGRNDRDADVDVLAGDFRPDAPVLGQALLGDVEPRHHLHARDDDGLKALRRRDDVVEDAVDPEADRQHALERLDVDVAGAVLDGLEEEGVDEPDDRRLVARLEKVARLLELGRDQVEPLLLEVSHEIGGAARGEIVGPD